MTARSWYTSNNSEDLSLTPIERAALAENAARAAHRLTRELRRFEAEPMVELGGPGEIVVLGAGLVGSLCAVMLAGKGYKVHLFERYGDIRSIPSQGRSINLSVTSRGLRAIRAMGGSTYEQVLALTTKVLGRIIHTDGPDGQDAVGFQRYGKDDSEFNYSVSRYELNAFLIEAADKAGVHIYFDHVLSETSEFSPAQGALLGAQLHFTQGPPQHPEAITRTRIHCNCPVVACDGGGSRVRYALRHCGLTEFTESLLSRGYKEVLFPHPAETLGEGKHFGTEQCHGGHGLHIWPRGEHMLMALPNLDGSFTGTVYMEARGPTSSFQALQDRQACAKWCAEHYGAAAPLAGGLDRLVEQLCHNPVGLLGTVCTERWAVDGRAVLIGDAAHAMVPFFGQGCNCGFEDVLWLGKMLDKHCPEPAAATGEHFAACFQELEQLRKPNADAICAMALENFVEMRDKTADPVFCAKKQLESLLENAFPERFRSRYAMVCYGGEGEVSYRNAYELGPIQDRILSTLHAQLPDNKDPVLDEALARQLIEELLEPELRARGMDLSTVRH